MKLVEHSHGLSRFDYSTSFRCWINLNVLVSIERIKQGRLLENGRILQKKVIFISLCEPKYSSWTISSMVFSNDVIRPIFSIIEAGYVCMCQIRRFSWSFRRYSIPWGCIFRENRYCDLIRRGASRFLQRCRVSRWMSSISSTALF